MGWREELQGLATPKGSVGLFALMVLARIVLVRFTALEISAAAIADGAVWGLLAVAMVQSWVRISAPSRTPAALAILSAGLFWLMFGRAVLGTGSAGFDAWIAGAIWGGITLAALAVLIAYRRT